MKEQEIFNTLKDLVYIKGTDDSLIPSYCFIEEFLNITGYDLADAIKVILDNGFKVYRTIPTEEIDETIIIAAKECPVAVILENYETYFGVDVELEDIEDVSFKKVEENIKNKKYLKEDALEEATAYMLRNDGKLFECDVIHPYIKYVYELSATTNIRLVIANNPEFFEWFYKNTNSQTTRKNIITFLQLLYLLKDDLGVDINVKNLKHLLKVLKIDPNSFKGKYNLDLLYNVYNVLNLDTNQEFCRVRTSDMLYGGDSGEIYFRISSIHFNWYNLIWDLVYKNKNFITDVTVCKDPQVFGNSDDYYAVGGKPILHMPVNDFITLSGNPIIEKLENKLPIINEANKLLQKGKTLSESYQSSHPKYILGYYSNDLVEGLSWDLNNVLHSNNSLIEDYETLCEDIEPMKKYYPNIPDDKFMDYIKLDPTYKEGSNNAGVYGKWILGLANKGEIENIGHLTDVLRRFDSEKAHLKNKDITKYKSVNEVEAMLNDDDSYNELSHRQEVRQRQKERHNVDLSKEAYKAYEDDDWEVWVPLTYPASCKLGQGTSWCTASTESDEYFEEYTDGGQISLYININKHNPNEKYQFYFGGNCEPQFMDKDDKKINLAKFLIKNQGLWEFYYSMFAGSDAQSLGIPNIYAYELLQANNFIAFYDGYNLVVPTNNTEDFYNVGGGEKQLIKSIKILDNVKSIGDYAFSYCSSLTDVTIPDGVKSIENGAFYECSELKSITIPNSVTSIKWYAFSRCINLINIVIPNGVTSIEEYAFSYCHSLTSITIPNSVTSIGNMAFYRSNNLIVTTNNKYVIDYCNRNGIKVKTLNEALKENLSKMVGKEMYVTSSPNDVMNYLKNTDHDIRILYDSNLDLYFLCNGDDYIHYDMIKQAEKEGYYWNLENFIDELGAIDNYIDYGVNGGYIGEDDSNFEWIGPYLYYIIFDPTGTWEVGMDDYDEKIKTSIGNFLTRDCNIEEIDLYKKIKDLQIKESKNTIDNSETLVYNSVVRQKERGNDSMKKKDIKSKKTEIKTKDNLTEETKEDTEMSKEELMDLILTTLPLVKFEDLSEEELNNWE